MLHPSKANRNHRHACTAMKMCAPLMSSKTRSIKNVFPSITIHTYINVSIFNRHYQTEASTIHCYIWLPWPLASTFFSSSSSFPVRPLPGFPQKLGHPLKEMRLFLLLWLMLHFQGPNGWFWLLAPVTTVTTGTRLLLLLFFFPLQ